MGKSGAVQLWLWLIATLTTSTLAQADINYDLELRSSQYLDAGQSYYSDSANSSNESFMFRSAGDKTTKSGFKTAWDLETEYSATENWNYIRPHEAYVSYEGFSLGRKKITWSSWEDRWGQTLVQPRFTDDHLRSSQAGLIGAFYEYEGNYFNVRVAASPIYVPEMGPHFWLANQHLTSLNPWFNAPISSFNYQGQTTNINYSENVPNTLSIINRPGGGAVFEWKPSPTMFSRISEAFVPMTQIMYGFPTYQKFNLADDSFDADLTPRFLYHNVLNYDLVFQHPKNEYGVSVADDRPVQDHLPINEDWELQEATNAIIASAYYTQYLNDSKTTSLTGSLLKIWGGDAPDQGIIQSSQNLFGRRYDYTEAASALLSRQWMNTTRLALNSQFKVVYDYLENGMIYSGSLAAQFHRDFSVSLSYDLFALLPGTPQMPDGFIDTYRGNDRVSMGMSYVF